MTKIRAILSFFLTLIITISPMLVPMSTMHAQGLSYSAEVNKSFDPINIIAGQVSRLSVTIYNPNAFELTNAAWTDNLTSLQPGIYIDNITTITNTCLGTVTAVAGGTTLALSGGTVQAQGTDPGECTVSVDVTSTTAGNLINTIPKYDPITAPGGLIATGGGGTVTNTTPASATLRVGSVQPPSLSKAFASNTIFVGDTSRLTITLRNNDLSNPLTETTFTDTLPLNVKLSSVVDPVLSGCGGGTVTAEPNTRPITLNNATVSANSICTVAVNVTSTIEGEYRNDIPAGGIHTRQGVTNASEAAAYLYVQNVGITKVFNPTSIVAGAMSTMTITLQNPTSNPYTLVGLSDQLPLGLIIGGTGTTTCCPSPPCPVELIDYPDGLDGMLGSNERTVRLTGGTVVASASPPTLSTCTITVPVTAPPDASAATLRNTIRAGELETFEEVTNPSDVSADLAVTRWLTGTKAFAPASIPAGGTSTATITLRNNRTDAVLTGINFIDTLPEGLTVSGTPTSLQCNTGTVTVSPDSKSISLAGGSIPINTTCTITFQVTGTTTSSYTNRILTRTITTGQGATNIGDISANLAIVTGGGPLGVEKSFLTSPIAPGANVRLRIRITSPSDTGVTGIAFTDVLPDGMRITNVPAASNGCGGSLTAVTGTNVISLVNGSRANPSSTCNIDVYVTADAAGSYPNTIAIGDVTSANPARSNTTPANATLVVSGFTMSKVFYPSTVNPNGYSTLTISLVNSSDVPITDVRLTDALSTMGGTVPTSGVYIANDPRISTTCCSTIPCPATFEYPDGGSGLGANERTIRMINGYIPARVGAVNGLCTIKVDVQGRGNATTRTNTIPVINASGLISGNPISPRAEATAPLTISNLTIGVVKKFIPLKIFGGSASTLSLELVNPNNAPLSGIAFTDSMPAGMFIANPANLNEGGCGGALTGSPGAQSFSFSGGSLAASSSCTLTLSVTMNVNGNLTNRIEANAVTTFNGATNPQPADATLTNLPGASISKFFATNPITAGGVTALTITIKNTGSAELTGLGFSDTLPVGLAIADEPAPAPVNNCSGALTAAPGTQLIRLENGTLAADATCDLTVNVTGEIPGSFRNCIPAGALTNNQGAQNKLEACDTLQIQGEVPTGVKEVDATTDSELEWKVMWINNSFPDPVLASSTDEIPEHATYVANGPGSGYDVPVTAPAGSVNTGVTCTDTSQDTFTTACYYEVPTATYPRGRVVWEGTLGSDMGITDPALAANKITITFSTTIDLSLEEIQNRAFVDCDLNLNATIDGSETQVAASEVTWQRTPPEQEPATLPDILPNTGFAPGVITHLLPQPFSKMYSDLGDLWLEIPSLGIATPILGIPISGNSWDVSWLGSRVGWLEGTAFPTWAGNSVLTAHVYDANGLPGPFLNLSQLSWGDKIIVHAWGQEYVYLVQTVKNNVRPNDVSSLKHEELPWLTLSTCLGYISSKDTYRYRVIVRAVQVLVK